MSKKKKLIPELRFPEFKNEGEWNYDKIDNLFHLQDGYAFSSNSFTDSKLNTKQVIRITDINNQNKNGDKVFVLEETAKALGVEKYKVKKGDLLLSLTGAAGFNFFIWESDDAYINQRTMKLNSKKKENDSLKVILEPLVHSKINEIGTGQNNNLSKDALKEIEFPFPNPKEQEKIASCLSSLDDLIEANSQKLELLKDHKKGLMQNLFPQEGEKVPKYRFPEFTKDGAWMETSVEENCLVKGRIGYRGYTTEDIVEKDKGALVLGGKHIQNQLLHLTDPTYLSWEKYYESPEIMVEVGDIIFSQRGTLGDCAIIDKEIGPATINPSMVLLKNITCDARFLYYILIGDSIQNEVHKNKAMGAIPMISQKQIREFPFLIPKPNEQQKIASCLSSLDEIISAQAEKIEQLKLHKKGLMQGLFPKIED